MSKQLSLIQVRHKAKMSRRTVTMGLRIPTNTLRMWEYKLEVPDEDMQTKLAKFYGVKVEDIQWKYKPGDVTIASQMMDVSPLTMRKYLREGRLGMAIKGNGDKWIYRVDWEEVEKWERLKYSSF